MRSRVTLAPKVKFENGKATEATLNWGEASAPMFIYPLIYAGTGFDNSDQCAGARGGAHDQRVHHQEMHRGEGGAPAGPN